jgi:tol-pal system protein YbgF
MPNHWAQTLHHPISVTKQWRNLLVVSLALGSSVAQAGLFDDDEARKAILELRAKVEAYQRENLERLAVFGGRLDRLEQTARGQLELSNQIEQLRSEIARLRGQIEVQANELAGLQRLNREQVAQLNERLTERLRRFEPVVMTIDGRQTSIDPAEKRGYEGAMALFQAGDFRAAQNSLLTFAAQYPQSPLRANAEYWAATSLYAVRDWRNAATALQAFTVKNPDSPRTPEALLSLGLAQLELKETPAGRKTLEQLIERYADSSAAGQAREKLASLPPERPRR